MVINKENKIDFGKRVLSCEEAENSVEQNTFWAHNGIRVFEVDYDAVAVESSIVLGTCWTTQPGAERDLRACQTIAEVRRAADWDGKTKWFAYIDAAGSADLCFTNEPRANWIKYRFDEYSNTIKRCIDSIGQDRPREVYEAGRSL